MNLEEKIGRFINLSQRIRNQEPPPVTLHQKQAAIVIAEIGQTLQGLIVEKMSIKVIFASLFYFWFNLEAHLRHLSEQQIDRGLTSLDETMKKIIDVINSVMNNLEDPESTSDMKNMEKTITALKSCLSDELFEHPSQRDELIRQTTNVNTQIHTIASNLLRQSFHPEIVANVLFSNWIRLSTMHACVSEKHYQKIEFYFAEIINAVRKQIPVLFWQPR